MKIRLLRRIRKQIRQNFKYTQLSEDTFLFQTKVFGVYYTYNVHWKISLALHHSVYGEFERYVMRQCVKVLRNS